MFIFAVLVKNFTVVKFRNLRIFAGCEINFCRLRNQISQQAAKFRTAIVQGDSTVVGLFFSALCTILSYMYIIIIYIFKKTFYFQKSYIKKIYCLSHIKLFIYLFNFQKKIKISQCAKFRSLRNLLLFSQPHFVFIIYFSSELRFRCFWYR